VPNTSLGIYRDGTRIFAALLRKEKNQILIESLENYNLISSYDESIDTDSFENEEDKVIDPFADNPAVGEDFSEEEVISGEDTNIDIIHQILADMAPKGTHIATNITVSKQIYNIQRIEKNTKSIRLKKELKARLLEERQLDIPDENIGFIHRKDEKYFVIAHSDPLNFTTDILELGDFLRRETIKLSFLDTIEFALANEINNTFSPEKTGHACVIFFSDSFTLIFFMKDGELEFVIPAISEGIESDKACQTALSRIMFEIDSGRVAPVDSIILTGEVARHNAVNFFTEEMNDVHIIQYLPNQEEFSSAFKGQLTRATIFAGAIALARKAMFPKKIQLYKNNYLPSYARDRQSIYNLGIASYALLIVLFIGAFYLTSQFFITQNKINTEKQKSTQLELKLASMANTASIVDSLRAEITELEKSTSLIDSLTQGSVLWFNCLDTLSTSYKEIGDFAVTNIENVGNEKIIYDINLEKKTDIVLVERFLENCFVKSINESESGKYFTVKYECNVTPGILKKD